MKISIDTQISSNDDIARALEEIQQAQQVRFLKGKREREKREKERSCFFLFCFDFLSFLFFDFMIDIF